MANSRKPHPLVNYLTGDIASSFASIKKQKAAAHETGTYSHISAAIGRMLDLPKGTAFYPGTELLINCWKDAQQTKNMKLWYLLANAIIAYDLLNFKNKLIPEIYDLFIKPFVNENDDESIDNTDSLATSYISGLILQPLSELYAKATHDLYIIELPENSSDNPEDMPKSAFAITQDKLPKNFKAILDKEMSLKEILKILETHYVNNEIKPNSLKAAVNHFLIDVAERELDSALENLEIHIISNNIYSIKSSVLKEVRYARSIIPENEQDTLPYYSRIKKLQLLTAVCDATAKHSIDANEYTNLIDEVSQHRWLKRLGVVAAVVGALLLIGGCITLAVLTGGIAIPFVIGTISAVLLGALAVGALGVGVFLMYKSIKHNPLERAMKNVPVREPTSSLNSA